MTVKHSGALDDHNADSPMDDDVLTKVAAKAAKTEVNADATFDALAKKPRRTLGFGVYSVNDAGEQITLRMKYQALSNTAYDKLAEAHPPNSKEKAAGATYHVDTFAPAIISAVSVIPPLSVDQATELYTSDTWSGGEVNSLFINALRVCNSGLDIPFNATD